MTVFNIWLKSRDFGLIFQSLPHITQDDLLNLAMQGPPNNKFSVNKRGDHRANAGLAGSAQLTGGSVHWPDGSVQREHDVTSF